MTEPSGWTQVTVYSREDKLTASGKDFVAFTDENGAKWNVFEPTAFAIIQPNNLLKVHWEQKGKFKNVKGIELVEKGATPEPPEPRINTQKQNSIEVQHAVGRTVELWNGGKLDDIPEGPTLKKRVVAYLLGKISGPDAEPQLVDVAKAHGAVAKKGLPTMGAFLNRCLKELKMQRPDVEAALEIPLVEGMNYDELYESLLDTLGIGDKSG